MAWRFASRALASGRCADDDWVDSGARTSVLAAVTSSPARAVVADKRTKAIRKNLRIVASIDDGDSLSYPGMKLCDLGHPSLPPREIRPLRAGSEAHRRVAPASSSAVRRRCEPLRPCP